MSLSDGAIRAKLGALHGSARTLGDQLTAMQAEVQARRAKLDAEQKLIDAARRRLNSVEDETWNGLAGTNKAEEMIKFAAKISAPLPEDVIVVVDREVSYASVCLDDAKRHLECADSIDRERV